MENKIEDFIKEWEERKEKIQDVSQTMRESHPVLYDAWVEHLSYKMEEFKRELERYERITQEELQGILDPTRENIEFLKAYIETYK